MKEVKLARKVRISISILLLAGMAVCEGFSQQLPLYSQYMMNKFLLNPAVAGSEGYTAFNITAREQWIGILIR